jgi:integrase
LATRKRYSTVVSRFIDYLYEVKVLGGAPVSRKTVNVSIDYYMQLLRDGELISLAGGTRKNPKYSDGCEIREKNLRDVARRLGIKPLASNSWENTLAPINSFLHLCSHLEHEAKEMSWLKGNIDKNLIIDAAWDYGPLLKAVDGNIAFSQSEVQHIKNSSMLGGVIRFRGSNLKRLKGLRKSSRQKSQIDVNSLAFPEEYFSSLLTNSNNYRDRALWTLMYASGIRRSEALNLQWCDINFEKQAVYVFDPNLIRYGRDISPSDRELRFKGRTVSWTYLRLPYREWFFDYLRIYRRKEYRLPLNGNNFVFQYLISPHFGRPLYEATDETLNSSFKSAVIRARIPGPPVNRDYIWTGHSLRHGFGKFMLNDFKVPGQVRPGLTEAEVQLMLGQKSITSTRKYAKLDDERLQSKLLEHDRSYIQGLGRAPNLLSLDNTNILL